MQMDASIAVDAGTKLAFPPAAMPSSLKDEAASALRLVSEFTEELQALLTKDVKPVSGLAAGLASLRREVESSTAFVTLKT